MKLSRSDQGVFVSQVFAGSAAERAGFEENDVLTAVNSQTLGSLTMDETIDRICGKPGDCFSVTVLRKLVPVSLSLCLK